MFGKVLEGDAPLAPQDAMCAWANKHGIDAFLRTEDHWEIINCDFPGTLKLLATRRVLPDEEKIDRSKPATTELSIPPPSFDGLSRGWKQDGPADPPRGRVPPPKGWIGSFPTYIGAETTTAAKWHDFAPGETRARPVLSKFVTFYDPAVKSLVAGRRGKTRDQHRLLGIDDEEAKLVIKQLEDAVDDEAGWNEKTGVSGVDWTTVLHVVVERYGERLEFLNHTLAGNTTAASKRSFKARQQVLTILTPYFTLFDTPPATSDSLDSRRAWLSPVVRRCAAAHTEGLPTHLFTKQEGLLLYAVQTVSHEICRRLGRTFSLAYDIDVIEAEMESDSSYDLVAEAMRLEISALLGWLDWVQVWVKCRPACSIDVSLLRSAATTLLFYPSHKINFFYSLLYRNTASPLMVYRARFLDVGLEPRTKEAVGSLSA
ncbi:hypothetical protein DL93DRAFT_2117822 [Clavulina sp. PMI_390]|nr:hypothetical protein DL93DRAFT_2117822 [Clavulina sp. PMI_390]